MPSSGQNGLSQVGELDRLRAEPHLQVIHVARQAEEARGRRRLLAARPWLARPASTSRSVSRRPSPSAPRRRGRGTSRGGRCPWCTAPRRECGRGSVAASTARSIRPPRLMSPRPTKSAGKSSLPPSASWKSSTYFPLATLPRTRTRSAAPRSRRGGARPARGDRDSASRRGRCPPRRSDGGAAIDLVRRHEAVAGRDHRDPGQRRGADARTRARSATCPGNRGRSGR